MKKYLYALLITTLAFPVIARPLDGVRDFHDFVSDKTTYTENFLGEFPVKIVMDGDCDRYETGNINLYVYDNNGYLIAKSESPVCFDQVMFTPRRDGQFKIVIRSMTKKKMGYDIHIEAEFGEPGEM